MSPFSPLTESSCSRCYAALGFWDPALYPKWGSDWDPKWDFIKESSSLFRVRVTYFLSSLAYVLFGGIHCLTWGFTPYSRIVWYMWVASSLVMTATPLVHLFVKWVIQMVWMHRPHSHHTLYVLGFIFHAEALAFLIARMILIIIPFLELSRLPNSAFKTVSWDDVLPHIG